jgi:redox-sensitive bicupin YhaK (pirin superfamily)
MNNRRYYLYVISGSVNINNYDLVEGDGLNYVSESIIDIKPNSESEIILFDLM